VGESGLLGFEEKWRSLKIIDWPKSNKRPKREKIYEGWGGGGGGVGGGGLKGIVEGEDWGGRRLLSWEMTRDKCGVVGGGGR